MRLLSTLWLLLLAAAGLYLIVTLVVVAVDHHRFCPHGQLRMVGKILVCTH